MSTVAIGTITGTGLRKMRATFRSKVKKSELELPEKYLDFIGKINTASIPTRYLDDLQRSLKEYPKSVAKNYLDQTIELIEWLKQHPNLSGS